MVVRPEMSPDAAYESNRKHNDAERDKARSKYC